MKILVSSKRFAEFLNNIDVDTVESCRVVDNKFHLRSALKSCSLPVESRETDTGTINQENVRWDWLKRDVYGIQEQPLVIEFFDNKATIILNY